jgi:hypothetical protein
MRHAFTTGNLLKYSELGQFPQIAIRQQSPCGGCGSRRMPSPRGAHFPRSMLPYTLGVMTWLKIIPFLIFASVCAMCQVHVTVPTQSFKASERIAAMVANVGDHEFLYCVEVGQASFKGPGVENMEATPIPFYVQRKSGRKWGTLLIGPDIGSFRSSVVLEPGPSLRKGLERCA